MTEMGHGLQIVNVTESHAYELNVELLKQLLLHEDVRDLPVVVVSVAGAYRGGKSFLLNFFLRYLSSTPSAREDGSWLGEDSEPLAGFQWRSGIKATTMGILMWSKPFVTTLPSGEKVAVLLVDTQGTFDSKSSVRDNSTIFALSTLVSSIQIYNISMNIKEDDLQHLELFTEYGKLVNTESNAKAFQVLEVLVRDWQFPEEYPYGTVGGERLLQEKLEITPDLAKEMKELRQHIRSSFEKVSCFLMPHPGFSVLRKTFNGNIRDIDPDFRAQLIDLVNSIFGPEKLLPKKINGERVKARELFNYFKTYMELFNSDEIPTPTNIMGATVKAGLLSAVSEAHDVYEEGMDSECGAKQLSVPAVDLKFLHEKYVALACASYNNKKKMGSAEEIAEYLDKLTKSLNERLPQFVQSNLSKIQTAIDNAKDAYERAVHNISKDQPLCVHPKDLEGVHKDGVDAAMETYDAARKRVTQLPEDERDTFLQELQKRYELLQRVNKQNNTMAVTELGMEYWQKMQSKTALDPPLSRAEFNEEHTVALNKALAEFNSKRNIPSYYDEDVYKYNLTKDIQESRINLELMNKSNNKNALNAAIDEYDKYMKRVWNESTKCFHPDDLEEVNRLGICRAFTDFRPKKQCSSGYDSDDEDEVTLNKILTKRYKNFKNNNDNANETAVLMAYNKYVDSIESNRRNVVTTAIIAAILATIDVHTLIATVPALYRSLSNKEQITGEAKTAALEVFNDQRRGGNGHYILDPYRERLEKMMADYNVEIKF